MAETRLNVVPSRMVLTQLKGRLVGIKKGWDLLKKKSDALTQRHRLVFRTIVNEKARMTMNLKKASFSLAEAKYSAGDFAPSVLQNTDVASLRVRAEMDNVAGVNIPEFAAFVEGSVGTELTGLSRGGQQISACREAYGKLVASLIRLAALQTSFLLLDEALRVTNRRANAIEHIILPRMENTISYVISEMDELDREDFFRLKKIQARKKRLKQEEEALLKLTERIADRVEDGDVPSMLGGREDEDIIFDM